jgi:tRNA A58 N-methylase Trm61
MKLYQTLLPLAAATIMAACGSRGTAQNVVGQAEGALTNVKEEAATTAPDELKTTQATVDHMKKNFESGEYKVVIADVPQFNEQMKTLKDAMAANQGKVAAATMEWTTLNNQVPKAVQEIQARVDSLKPNALPKEVTKEELATAKMDLETLKSQWAEATAAAQDNKPLEATEKGRMVQTKAEELKNTLGMNQTVASAG